MKTITFQQILLISVLFLVPLFNLILRRLSRRSELEGPRDPSRKAQDLPAQLHARRPTPARKSLKPEEGGRAAPSEAAGPRPSRRRFDHSRLASLREARRGIVLMTILGPCRALEPPQH